MELRAVRTLHAVIGPQGLFAVAHLYLIEGAFSLMRAGEGMMSRRMPVLGEDDVFEMRRDLVDYRDDLVTARDGQRSAGAEVVLHVDDEEDILRGDVHFA